MKISDALLLYLQTESSNHSMSSSPLYQKVYNILKSGIKDGIIRDNEALPSERDLTEALNVSRVTIRKAIEQLALDGLVIQRRGAGTFVNLRVEQPLSKLTGFTEDITARGQKPSIKWLDRSCGSATPEESLTLKLSPGALVSRLHRLRFADGKPMCIEHATLPQYALPEPENLEGSLYIQLEARGLRPTRALQRLRAQIITPEHAELLEVPEGTACLYIERCSFLPNGAEIEFVRSYYRGDSYDFVAELQL